MPKPDPARDRSDATETLHASAVAWQGCAVLITGASGSGKSSLALQLIGLGARLVADDGVVLRRAGDRLLAAPPPQIAGRIEARHVGLLRLPYEREAEVTLAVNLDQREPKRLPPRREADFLGLKVTLLYGTDAPHFPQAILHCLENARTEP